MQTNDTIIALSTPVAQSAIGVVRLSGSEALTYLSKTVPNHPPFVSHHARFAKLFHPQSEKLVDEAVYTVFLSPNSYTGEDVVEISAHGNPFILKEIVEMFVEMGCRHAEPGEFTERAYLNGKMDLTEAEAVNDLIRAHTRYARAQALGHLTGKFSEVINGLQQRTLDLLALLEVAIDHSDLEEELPDYNEYKIRLEALMMDLNALIESSPAGRMIEQGMKIAIVGAPNAGKSSLMNLLLREDRVIVTDIEGTTRDTVEDELNIRGIPVRLTDTAGVRKTEDVIEQKGIERTLRAIDNADLRILLFDGSRNANERDRELFFLMKDKPALYVLNKSDVAVDSARLSIPENVRDELISLSTLTGDGLDRLEQAISDFYFSFGFDPLTDVLVVNARQEDCLRRAVKHLKRGLDTIEKFLSEEFITAEVRKARDALEEITGKSTHDELLDRIFSQFCIGK